MAQSRGSEEENIPPDKVGKEHLDWFDLDKRCIKLIENVKSTPNSGQMYKNFKMKTCNKLENMLSSTHLQTPNTGQVYENSYAEMKLVEEPLNIEYELDSGINSDYDSTDSEKEKQEWSDAIEYNIVKECENNDRELDKKSGKQ